MKILAIYDNGGKTIDRYTVYYDEMWSPSCNSCLCMSDDPFYPLGVCQHSGGQLGDHNGKQITFEQLSSDCQKAVLNDMEEA